MTNSQKFSKDLQEILREKAQKKLEWATKRFIDICIGVDKVSKLDNLQELFKEKVNEVARKYPKANYQALVSFISLIPETKQSLTDIVKKF